MCLWPLSGGFAQISEGVRPGLGGAFRGDEGVEQGGDILDLFGEHMGDLVRALHAAGDTQHAACNDGAAEAFVDVAPDDNVHDTGFIFKREEDHPLGGAGALAENDKACNADAGIVGGAGQIRGAQAGRWAGPVVMCGGGAWRGVDLHRNKNRTFWQIGKFGQGGYAKGLARPIWQG